MVELENAGRKWTPLRNLCEAHGIAYRYRSERVSRDASVETRILIAPCRMGKQLRKMVCIPVDLVDYVLAMPCPGSGGHNKKGKRRGPYKKNHPGWEIGHDSSGIKEALRLSGRTPDGQDF